MFSKFLKKDLNSWCILQSSSEAVAGILKSEKSCQS